MEATRIKEGRAGQGGQNVASAFYDLATSDSGNKSSGDSAWRQRASDDATATIFALPRCQQRRLCRKALWVVAPSLVAYDFLIPPTRRR